MRRYRIFAFMIAMSLFIQAFAIIFQSSFVFGTNETGASPSQFGLINVALTKNVAPRSDWSNGTLYHLRILQKFIPINITVITSFATLSDYQVLFLNMLNVDDSDIASIRNWVSAGGILVCIGQSGRYNENGEERTSHPFETVLGITLNRWERTNGAEVRQILINKIWHWWTSAMVYDVTNNGDGNYFELADTYYIPKSECVNVTLDGATQIMSCRDKNIASYFPPYPNFTTYEEPFLTTNTYGSGKAFFITADAFYRLVWKPSPGGVGLYNLDLNSMTAGFWFRSGLLWQILYAIMFDCFSDIPLPIVTSMPHGSYTAMSFGIKTTSSGAYGNLTQYWQPQMLDKQPMLKGWFWGFWLLASVIDGTSDADDIVNFVNEYGYAGSRPEGNLTLAAFEESSEILRNHGFMYKYEGSAGGPVGISTVATLVKDWNFTDIFYHRRISGRTEHGAYISSIPYPISDSGGLVNFFVSPYAVSQTYEWKWLIEHQKLLGQEYGIGGYCMGTDYAHWVSYIPNFNETINTFVDDDTVWKASGQLFVDWWDKRWQVNITDFSANSTLITVDLQTPDIQNLTLLIKDMPNPYREITIDGTPLTSLPESNRIVIPQLSQGIHRIVIKFAKIFATSELKQYNDQLKVEGKPYIVDTTHVIEYLNYTNQRLSLTLDLPANATAELKVYSSSPYFPRQAFADGQPISFTYSTNLITLLVPYAHVDIYYAQPQITEFTSSKLSYESYEDVELSLKVYGDYSTSGIIKWLARVTVLDQAEEIFNVTNREVEIRRASTSNLIFSMGKFLTGTYTVTAEMLDPENLGNVLAMDSLTISVAYAMFATSELRGYNDQLKVEGKPYVVDSTNVIEYLNYTNQRLSLTLDLPANATAELKVYSSSPYFPRQAFADGQPPQSFAYASNIATLLVGRAHVDIYYAQPQISRFSSSKLEYRTDEDVSLTLEIYGDHSTSEPLKWLARVTVLEGTQEIVNVTKQVEISTAEAVRRDFTVEELSEGIYTIIAEMLDPEAGNVLATDSLTISVTEIPTAPLIFDTVELKEYNDDLKSWGLPYVEGSTQTIKDLAFSNTYQRLSITLDAHLGVKSELKVYSTYSPRQVFANGQPISFTYSANIVTILTPYAHVDIYYAQPKITEFNPLKSSYEPDEDVELVLKVYGDYSTPEIIEWLIRFTIEDETEKIVKTVYEEIELNATQSLSLQLAVGKFSEGTYTITAEMIDPEAENILETRSLTVKVAEAPTLFPLIPLVFITTTIVAIIVTGVYTWYRLKKPKMRAL